MKNKALFGERLRILLQIKHLNQTEFANAIHTTPSNISRYLSGRYEAKAILLFRIQRAYGVNPMWLLGYDEPMEEQIQFINERLSTQEKEVIEMLRALDDRGRDCVMDLLKKEHRYSIGAIGKEEKQM